MADRSDATSHRWVRMDKPGVEIYHVDSTLRAHREGDQWAAECVEFGTHSCGDEVDEALENALQATLLYLNTIEAMGLRREIFEERGIDVHLAVEGPYEVPTFPVDMNEFVTRFAARKVSADDAQLV